MADTPAEPTTDPEEDWPGSYYDARGDLTPIGQMAMDDADAKRAMREAEADRAAHERHLARELEPEAG